MTRTLLTLALLATGCSGIVDTNVVTGPTPIVAVVTPPVVAPSPAVFRVDIYPEGNNELFVPLPPFSNIRQYQYVYWNGLVLIRGDAAPSAVSLDCASNDPAQELPNALNVAVGISCRFWQQRDHVVAVIARNSAGQTFTGTSTVRVR